MKIFLCRHGETNWNKTGRLQGASDTSINAHGMKQAGAVGKYLKNEVFDFCYASDLKRVRQTLKEILRFHECKPVFTSELREINVGIYEGLTYKDIKAKDPVSYFKRIEFKYDFLHPQGESYREMDEKRIRPFLKRICEKHKNDTLLIVAHEGVNRIILSNLLKLDPKTSIVRHPNDCIYIIEGNKKFSSRFVFPIQSMKGEGYLEYL
jgi:alpha-ribazole phosphatase